MMRTLVGILAVLLPDPPREEWARRCGVDAALWSGLFGLLYFFFGGYLLIADFLVYIQEATEAVTSPILKADPKVLGSFDAKLAFAWSGSLSWLYWLTRPWTWLLAGPPIMGLVRLTAFAVSREAVADPWIWALWRGVEGVRSRMGSARRRVRFGPPRPDRWEREAGCDLVLLTSRPRPDFARTSTIEVGERFYRLLSHQERQTADGWVHAYRLAEADDAEVIRRLVRYEGSAPPE